MRELLILLAGLSFGCGYHSMGNEGIGQIKKVVHNTPIICPNRWDVDLSLGVMRGGSGSMSHEDLWFTVDDPTMLATLKSANETGGIVKIVYNVKRFVWCSEDHLVEKVEVVK